MFRGGYCEVIRVRFAVAPRKDNGEERLCPSVSIDLGSTADVSDPCGPATASSTDDVGNSEWKQNAHLLPV